MASVHEVIEAFRAAPSNSERGTKFEQLMVRYFELDPMLSQQYDQVWRWIDWPGRGGKPDTGIDLVARERDTGEYTAIQCKFYEPTHTLAKADIDSFFTASGKKPFTNRVIISTTDRWGRNAEDALEDQTTPVQRIGLAEIAESPIDWNIAWPQGELHVDLAEAKRHDPRLHQQDAIDAVFAGFEAGNDRGKLIMACGTGKTFTALKIAERTATENGGSARILFAVPSISLLSQTLREWTAQTQLDLRAFAVCSDTKVSRSAEDMGIHDVAIPVTTDPVKLAAEMGHRKRAKGLTVVFTTYQSLPVVAAAQKNGVDRFDLVICDEAHRTTGVTLFGEDESNFVRVHDADYLQSDRRLYMTATPRLFDDKVKDQAEEHSAELTSMDDETIYGPEFHRLSFGDAVGRGLLTDYKVIVLTVDEELIASPMQAQLAGDFSELRLDDASKIVGCWNGLAKRAGRTPDGTGFAPGEAPMRRGVAFAKDIAASKQVAEVFPAVVDAYRELLGDTENDGQSVDGTNLDLSCAVRHVDGTFNALQRNAELAWLKAPVPEGECRILTNARCLSEGVDVPALDAVMFLNPRNSVVDVVQSVGRVMRKADNKDYGYIILPVAVPAGVSPSQALSDNRRFKVVWQVLNALRAHDDRFNAMVNSIALNAKSDTKTGKGNDRLMGGHIGPTRDSDESVDNSGTGTTGSNGTATDAAPDSGPAGGQMAQQMALFSLSEWQEAIVAKIVDKVGTRAYWEDWATDVADIAAAQITRIRALLDGADAEVAAAFERFLQGLQDNLNDSITEADAISMLSQHLITKPVFDALFAGHDFASHNPVSRVMQTMLDTLGDSGLEAETAKLDGFYDSVRVRAAEVTTADGKQQVIADLYEKFFRIGFRKQSEALGIVYTPVEVVDFILRAADQASRDAFGRGLTDEGVHILDPFTGTGTFMTRLLQSGLIDPTDLKRKYADELHANEIMLLAYYIAAVNIESTYHALIGSEDAAEYTPFEGIVLADTFQITENGDSLDAVMFPQNNDRIVRQNTIPINVVIGNPPYSVGQTSANDLNANISYPTLDGRIAATYAKLSTATSQRTLYDSYLRAFRWATDRIGDSGVVAFVSNGGWIDSNTSDGIRLSLADEYSRIYVYNLRGNQRTAGELSRKEGGKVFGAGSRNTVAILIGVKNPDHTGDCEIFYRDIGDYLTREEKLAIVAGGDLGTVDWQAATPNAHGDWINHRSDEFEIWPAIGSRSVQDDVAVFSRYSLGVGTNRDAWVVGYSRRVVEANVRHLIASYNAEIAPFAEYCAGRGITRPTESTVGAFLAIRPDAANPTKIKWSRKLRTSLAKGVALSFDAASLTRSQYRPMNGQHTYFDAQLNEERFQIPKLFPTPHHRNFGIAAIGPRQAADFAAIVTAAVPDMNMFTYPAQFFPRWTYEKAGSPDGELDFRTDNPASETDEYGYRRIDNITDGILALYRGAVGDQVTKDDIFYYVYGLLHDPAYRETYAADLKKMLPHIPTPESRDRFEQLVAAGGKLADLHVNYETVEPYDLDVQLKKGASAQDRETWRVSKMKWSKKKDPETGKNVDDRTTIVYNPTVTIAGIPEDAERYMLGSRSALAWIIDRYQVKTDKASGIVNDPNDWCDEHDNPRYIVELIQRVAAVSVETMKVVDSLNGGD
ncbi:MULTISPECIES: DEAD/DEAH box helicase [unclassified Rhodococcus (in: high G+C Gram-positive bacteria)]|uniref:DEAD/DEAH box helicase n=1 Tax=unclassified Rhodococcus (in: high G+C Gram-positive bacteria) TaxID=192944 RepID=UPI00163A59CD|nr:MULTISPECIES: DEAD/DEAH box helicase [unclassified Rhodococcus (in: high G+C Gram-positive bacteria)]MBC2637513.1 DEAD/DEAH box helicase [Rhodococcus sp. 3A]MBC2898395.1 DEAD/DEAH box helicase [Rhodococcus sp. 4CII]